MLREVHLRNFGAIGPSGITIPIERVTVLVGANGTGKTSVLRGLGILRQTAERRDRLGLVHEGPRVRFAEAADMHFGLRVSEPLTIGVTVQLDRRAAQALARRHEAVSVPPETKLRYTCSSSNERGISRIQQSIEVGGRSATVARETSPNQLLIDGKPTASSASPDQVLESNAFRPLNGDETLFANAVEAVSRFVERRIRLVATLRGAERFSLDHTTSPNEDSGPDGVFTLQFMTEARLRWPDRGVVLDDWLEQLGLHRFRVGPEAGRFAPRFDDRASGATLPLYLAAQGHQQILEFVALLAFAERGSVIIVEEPENGLHPAAQVVAAEIVADATRRHDLQVILCTQSPTFALACCRAVKRGHLRPEDLGLCELSRAPDNHVVLQTLRVDSAGFTHPSWFSGFARAEAELIGEFLPAEETTKEAPEKKARSGGTRHKSPPRRRG